MHERGARSGALLEEASKGIYVCSGDEGHCAAADLLSTEMADDRASWAATVFGLALLALLAPPGRCEDVAPPYGEISAA